MPVPDGKIDSQPASIANLRVEELLAAIGSAHVSPGAGAAGAVTLALAAACANKAIAISLKHTPGDAELQDAHAAITKIGAFALAGADRDAEAFEEFIRARGPGTTAALLREGNELGRLIQAFLHITCELKAAIEPSMAGDLVAAKALADAAHVIQSSNQSEAEASRLA
jgi:hypothetical protein